MALSWTKLPAEIRCMILKIVADDSNSEHSYIRVGYTTVCREWQPVFEKETFKSLILNQNRIYGLKEFMEGVNIYRQKYLYKIFLHIQLQQYDCKVCRTKEDDTTIRNNNDIFSKAISDLLTILSQWKSSTRLPGCSQIEGLILELGASSPSDCRHTPLNDFRLEDNYPYYEKSDLDPDFKAYREYGKSFKNSIDYCYGSVNRRNKFCGSRPEWRVMGTLTVDENKTNLPEVTIVRGLLIRRRFYRRIASSTINKLFCTSFTCLEWFRHEGWHNVDLHQQLAFERGYEILLKNLPNTLRYLYIFKDFNENLDPPRFAVKQYSTQLMVGRTLSKSSRSLEHLSAAFLAKAQDFFDDFWPGKPLDAVTPWENLRMLVLTSQFLNPLIYVTKMDKLLIAAGRAAAFMPKLEVMELWNCGGENSCIFTYRHIKDDDSSRIDWTVTPEWGNRVPSLSVYHCWENLPQHNNGQTKFSFERHLMPNGNNPMCKKSITTTLSNMVTRNHVLDHVSQYQLAWEECGRFAVCPRFEKEE